MPPVRLSPAEISALLETFAQFFLPEDELWLFGSRADLTAKGGDIDLFVKTKMTDSKQVFDTKINFLVALKQKIGDQKIDLVIQFTQDVLPIYEVAQETGVRLK